MNLPKRTGSSTGYLYGFLCAFFSAVMIVLIKRVQESLPTLSILVIVLAVAALVLSGVMFTGGRHRLLLRVSAHGWFWVGGIAVLTFFCYWTLFAAIDLLDPTVASFLGRAETLVTIAFGVVFLGERFRRIEIAGAVLVLSGVGLIRYTGGVEISRGFVLCIVACILWGVTEGLAKVAVRHASPLFFTWGRTVLLAPAFYCTALASNGGLVLPDSTHLWILVIALSLSGPVVARYLYMKCLTLLPVSRAALINQSQPIWVAVIAGVCLGVLPGPREWIGGGLIIAGCLLLVRRRKNSP